MAYGVAMKWMLAIVAVLAGVVLARPLLAPPSDPTILFVGDIMLDRHVRGMMRVHGEDQPFACVSELLTSADYTVGNLEGPITPHPSTSEGSVVGGASNYTFTFSPAVAPLLARFGIDAVSLGNNHIGDQGSEGMAMTRQYLESAGVSHFGGVVGSEPVHHTTIKGHSFAFVAYNQFGGSTPEQIASLIKHEAIAHKVIVVAHWGDEYVAETESMKATARLFAESGATLIVGAHPHVVQGHEYITTTLVYYSLGNFIFDQYWEPAVSEGMALRVTFGASTTATTIPVRMTRDGRTCPVHDPLSHTLYPGMHGTHPLH
jgi:gamma-polyglutamate biosynthesis protein CapA